MIALRTDRQLIRAGARSTRYVLVEVDVPRGEPARQRPPLDVALVLDRSGSMEGERKFVLARQAVERALAMLRPTDRFALVVYDDQVDVLVPSTPASDESRRLALRLLGDVRPRGSTNLSGGWLRGCEEVARTLAPDAVARVLLLTDGLANDGITDPERLAHHAAEWRQRGVTTSTLGVGADFDERLLRDMAHEGGGNFYFMEAPVQIPDLLSSELGEALDIAVRRAALELLLPAGADAEPLNRFRHTRATGDGELRVDLGDLVSGQQLRVVVKITFARGTEGASSELGVSLAGDDLLQPLATGAIGWRYASHAENDRQPRDAVVDREVALLYAARARAEAAEANRRGAFRDARRVLERTAERIMRYAGDDPVLRGIARDLRDDVSRYSAAPMGAMALKDAVFASEMTSKGRTSRGRARRRDGEG